ncbi:MAG TPA: hypothetical protein VGG35_13815 [Streptosporangiaceae bacterium]|jgi:hypothetical protein
MLSGLPGIRNAGPVTAPLGRRGTAILLAPGSALGWAALRKAAWTSHPARHAVIPPG